MPVSRALSGPFATTLCLLGMMVAVAHCTLEQWALGVDQAVGTAIRQWFFWTEIKGVFLPIFPAARCTTALLILCLFSSLGFFVPRSLRQCALLLIHVGMALGLFYLVYLSPHQHDGVFAIGINETAGYAESLEEDVLRVRRGEFEISMGLRDRMERLPRQLLNNGETLEVLQYLPHAIADDSGAYRSIRGSDRADKECSAVCVRLTGADSSEVFWVEQGVDHNGFSLAPRQLPLPFHVQLMNFSIHRSEDSQTVTTASSFVSIRDSMGREETHRLSVNAPIQVDQWTLYQVAFVGDQEQVVFRAVKKTAALVPYLAALLIITGACIAIFSSRHTVLVDPNSVNQPCDPTDSRSCHVAETAGAAMVA